MNAIKRLTTNVLKAADDCSCDVIRLEVERDKANLFLEKDFIPFWVTIRKDTESVDMALDINIAFLNARDKQKAGGRG